MPLRIRWGSKDYIGVALLLFGACGLFQTFIIFLAIYILNVGSYFVVILIPIGVTLALYYGSLISYESFAQVERRRLLKTQYRKKNPKRPIISALVTSPILKPLMVLFSSFLIFFLITFFICILFLDNIISFIITEFISTMLCLLIANYIERILAGVKRY